MVASGSHADDVFAIERCDLGRARNIGLGRPRHSLPLSSAPQPKASPEELMAMAKLAPFATGHRGESRHDLGGGHHHLGRRDRPCPSCPSLFSPDDTADHQR